MFIPNDIVKSVKRGECILFLGAMASAPSPKESLFKYEKTQAPPSGVELAQSLADDCDCYPYENKKDLKRVSLYYQYRDQGGSRHSLVQAIIEKINADGIVPSPALHMLASLPFRIVVTTNYDHLFENAIRTVKVNNRFKEPIVRIYDPDPNGFPEEVPLDPEIYKPILLKLHGDIDKPESLVVTEEDYIIFIMRMSDRHVHPIHENIRARMKCWPILFIGYSLQDYNLRLLFKTLRWRVDPANFPLSYSVDPFPDDLIVSVWHSGKKRILSFIKEDLWNVIPELYKQVKGVEYKP
ncbi:MAG: SIR2 family NAD-dependent protein deacylase [Candidatus Kariarchaeaceae archaeon]|jgi:hypothetical protein